MPLLRWILAVQAHYPSAYWHPRWPTTGHVMPARVFWHYVAGMLADRALDRLSMVRAIGLAMAPQDHPVGRRLLAEDQREALALRTE